MTSLYFDWDICSLCLHSIKHHSIGPDTMSFMCIVINMTTHKQCKCKFMVEPIEAQKRIKEYLKNVHE